MIAAAKEGEEEEIQPQHRCRVALAGDLFATEALRRNLAGMVLEGFMRDVGSLEQLKQSVLKNANSSSTTRNVEAVARFQCFALNHKMGFYTPYAGTAQHPALEMQRPIVLNKQKKTSTSRLLQDDSSLLVDEVLVEPGDILVGDDDGLLVGSVDAFSTLLPLAREIHATEAAIRQQLLESIQLSRNKNENGDDKASGDDTVSTVSPSTGGLVSMTNLSEHLERRKQGKDSNLELRPPAS